MTVLRVVGLARPDGLLEIDAVAVLGQKVARIRVGPPGGLVISRVPRAGGAGGQPTLCHGCP